MRHMMNCSDKDEYMRRIAELQTALESRGYPRSVLQSPAYDAGKRTAFFTSRSFNVNVNLKNLVVQGI